MVCSGALMISVNDTLRDLDMDRDEALRLLMGGKPGVQEWNQRRESGEEIPDLSGADLDHANLSDANLSHANLGGANLNGVDLSDANLSGANLDYAILGGAKLRRAYLGTAAFGGADLSGADLSGADMRRADLIDADLSGAKLLAANLLAANLSKANLLAADFGEALCERTNFSNVDLSKTSGLDSVKHEGPSTIGIDTLLLSHGKIPEAFLHECGMPQRWIDYLPSLMEMLEPIHFYSCFISYSTKNQDFAERLHSKMRDKGLRVWFSPEDIQGGKKLHEQIDEAIRVYDKLLLVLSHESMDSEWVKTEIRRARRAELKENRRKLFPIRLVDFTTIRDWECFDSDSGKDLGVEIREYFIPDFSDWKNHDAFEAAFARLLKDLKAEGATGAKPV